LEISEASGAPRRLAPSFPTAAPDELKRTIAVKFEKLSKKFSGTWQIKRQKE